MDHPAIARVFDAGATPQGRPYFVMEYVRGEIDHRVCDPPQAAAPSNASICSCRSARASSTRIRKGSSTET